MTIVANSIKDDIDPFKRFLLDEIQRGGELKELPCPFCGLPRCQRSSYIRCSRCGKNWDLGTEYHRHPTLTGKPQASLQ